VDETYLYQKIADTIRQEILDGKRTPGEKLPPVRELTHTWNCTPGTVQRAYKILALQGLVTSRPGQGTHITAQTIVPGNQSLRRAALVNRSEAFLLETLTAGYTQNEIEQALQIAFDRWRILQSEITPSQTDTLTFTGSNDPVISWMAAHFPDISPGYQLHLQFGGSLSGLIALAENRTQLAGCHLWDEGTRDYNYAYVERILPGKKTALVTLAARTLGLILPAGNPLNIRSVTDLTRPGIRFINRQSGSGTRVWLDSRLREHQIDPDMIPGYTYEKATHTEVARAIATGEVNAALGLEAAANLYALDFIPLTQEIYEIAILQDNFDHPAVQKLVSWLASKPAKQAISAYSGYDTIHTGQIRWVN
jgi:putative molybdopterin biosynthesis protein